MPPAQFEKLVPSKNLSNLLNLGSSRQISIADIGDEFMWDFERRSGVGIRIIHIWIKRDPPVSFISVVHQSFFQWDVSLDHSEAQEEEPFPMNGSRHQTVVSCVASHCT